MSVTQEKAGESRVPRWASVHGGTIWHRFDNTTQKILCDPNRARSEILTSIMPNDPSPEARCKGCEQVQAKNLQRAQAGRPPENPKPPAKEETHLPGTTSERMGEILRQRLVLKKAAEELEEKKGSLKAATAAHKLAVENHENQERILLEIIDDKPTELPFPKGGAGDGRIQNPDSTDEGDEGDGDPEKTGDVDERHAAKTTTNANKRRGRPKKNP